MPFQFTPYQPDTRSILALMQAGPAARAAALRASGDAQARAMEIGGQARAQAAQSIGQNISGSIGDILKQREEAPYRAAQIENMRAQAEDRKLAAQQRTADTATNQTIDELMKSSLTTDPTTGATTYDRGKLQQGFTQANIGHLWPKYSELVDKSDASVKTLKEAHHNAIKDVAALVDAAGNDATVFTNELMRGVKNGLFTEAEAAPLFEAVQRDPTHVAKITSMVLGKKPELMPVNPGDVVIDKNNPQGGAVFTAPPKPETSAKPMEQQLLEAEQSGNKALAAQIRGVMNARDVNMAPPDQSAVALSPAGLDAAAMMFAKTGQLPPMGMGAAAAQARTKIINRAAVLMPDLDLASAKADFSANQDSLKALTKQRDAISAFEQTATKNIDIFLDQAKKVIDTGSPLLNTPLRLISGQVLGATDPAAYNAARQVAVNEIAKITSNPSLSGQLSDSARHEVEQFNPQNATLKQTVAVMKLLKQDMANRATSMDTQIAAIKGRIGKGNATTTPTVTAPPAGSAPTYADYLKSRGGK